MRFYLGTHEPTWLNRSHVPLFVSCIRIRERCRRKLPKARVPWALDSGGFSQLNPKGPGRYTTTPEEYAAEVARWSDAIGNLDWAAIQDWMCEPFVLAHTGLTVAEHQCRTVQSYLDLRRIAPRLPWVPVLQGFTLAEYRECARQYAAAGVNLGECPTVGIGSVCRRQGTDEAARIIHQLAADGLAGRIHAFGYKLEGLPGVRDVLGSADSLAWSDSARRKMNAARRRAEADARCGSLFGCEPAELPTGSPQNDPAPALAFMHKAQHAAGMIEGSELSLCCPYCDSWEVSPPGSSSLDYTCVNCGESWGDVREPDLLHRS